MADFNMFDAFPEHLFEKVHDFSADSFALFLCAAANAPVAGNSVLADLTEISYTNASSRALTVSTSAQTSGVYKWVVADKVITASGAVGPFRYVGIYNDTPTSPADPLIGWYDYGSEITLADTETLTVNFDDAEGVLQAALAP
ncbi:MAG: hypothetical protein AB7R90_19495 [Reyranellaceae bacterium]